MAPPRSPRTNVKTVTPPPKRRAVWTHPAVIVTVVLLVLGGLFLVFRSGNSVLASKDYQVGNPGVGAESAPFRLASTTGQPVSLSDYRGKTALLYFHEGLGCQPCWDQIRDLQDGSALRAVGIDDLITITLGPGRPHRPEDERRQALRGRAGRCQSGDLPAVRGQPVRDDGRLPQRAHLHPGRPGRAHPVARRLLRRPELHHVRGTGPPARGSPSSAGTR